MNGAAKFQVVSVNVCLLKCWLSVTTPADNRTGASPPMVETLVRNMYVDDMPKSHRTVDDAIVCISELILLCASGGFPVSNFACNNWVVLESVPEPLRAAGVRSIDFDQVCLQKTLGVA